MAVLPSHRRKGIGSLLMNVGTLRADELGLECWMEASFMGKALYKHHGFLSLLQVQFDMEREDATAVWRKCVHELSPAPFSAMWRPRGGGCKQDEPVLLPWDRDTR